MYQVSLKTNQKQLLLMYLFFLKNFLQRLNVSYTYTILKKRLLPITLLRSPHVNKKAKEQFQMTSYKLIINLNNIPLQVLNYLLINRPSTFSLKIKMSSN